MTIQEMCKNGKHVLDEYNRAPFICNKCGAVDCFECSIHTHLDSKELNAICSTCGHNTPCVKVVTPGYIFAGYNIEERLDEIFAEYEEKMEAVKNGAKLCPICEELVNHETGKCNHDSCN